jgi:hypothetical protein
MIEIDRYKTILFYVLVFLGRFISVLPLTLQWCRRLFQGLYQTLKSPENRLIIAIPVAPNDTVDLLKEEADHVEVMISPSTYSFRSVGQVLSKL